MSMSMYLEIYVTLNAFKCVSWLAIYSYVAPFDDPYNNYNIYLNVRRYHFTTFSPRLQ